MDFLISERGVKLRLPKAGQPTENSLIRDTVVAQTSQRTS